MVASKSDVLARYTFSDRAKGVSMASQYLRDAGGQIYAIIDEESGGNLVIRTYEHGILGRYYAVPNITVELRTGQIIARGNALACLVQPPRY